MITIGRCYQQLYKWIIVFACLCLDVCVSWGCLDTPPKDCWSGFPGRARRKWRKWKENRGRKTLFVGMYTYSVWSVRQASSHPWAFYTQPPTTSERKPKNIKTYVHTSHRTFHPKPLWIFANMLEKQQEIWWYTIFGYCPFTNFHPKRLTPTFHRRFCVYYM